MQFSATFRVDVTGEPCKMQCIQCAYLRLDQVKTPGITGYSEAILLGGLFLWGTRWTDSGLQQQSESAATDHSKKAGEAYWSGLVKTERTTFQRLVTPCTENATARCSRHT